MQLLDECGLLPRRQWIQMRLHDNRPPSPASCHWGKKIKKKKEKNPGVITSGCVLIFGLLVYIFWVLTIHLSLDKRHKDYILRHIRNTWNPSLVRIHQILIANTSKRFVGKVKATFPESYCRKCKTGWKRISRKVIHSRSPFPHEYTRDIRLIAFSTMQLHVTRLP